LVNDSLIAYSGNPVHGGRTVSSRNAERSAQVEFPKHLQRMAVGVAAREHSRQSDAIEAVTPEGAFDGPHWTVNGDQRSPQIRSAQKVR
jgi:hypothetical protein